MLLTYTVQMAMYVMLHDVLLIIVVRRECTVRGRPGANLLPKIVEPMRYRGGRGSDLTYRGCGGGGAARGDNLTYRGGGRGDNLTYRGGGERGQSHI